MHIIQHFKLWCGLLDSLYGRAWIIYIVDQREKEFFGVFFWKKFPLPYANHVNRKFFLKKNNYVLRFSAFNGIMVMFNYLFIVCEFINFFEILIFTSWNESLYIYIIDEHVAILIRVLKDYYMKIMMFSIYKKTQKIFNIFIYMDVISQIIAPTKDRFQT